MDKFTGVIATATIAEPEQPVAVEGCPREALALTCLRGSFDCLCTVVTAWEASREDKRVVLTLHAPRGLEAEAPIHQHLDLLPLRFAFTGGAPGVVQVAFDLSRPENAELAQSINSQQI